MQQYISSYTHAQPNVYRDSKTGNYKHIIGVSYGFELNNPKTLVPLTKLSMPLNKLLEAQKTGYDEGYDKPKAEFLVFDNLPAVKIPKELVVKVGNVTKTIIQQPKRVWKRKGAHYIIESVDDNSVVPLSYTKAYGSKEYAKNPMGIGHFGKEFSEELPMFEYKSNQVQSPIDKGIEPAGLSGKHVLCSSRSQYLGKYSKAEQKAIAATPGFPNSMDSQFFMMSSPDQWVDELGAGTSYSLKGFGSGEIAGNLPDYKATILTKAKDGSYKEHQGVIDTLVLLPSLNFGIVITRFVFEGKSAKLGDEYDYAMIQLDDCEKPREFSENVEYLENRIADPRSTGLEEQDLLPESMN